MPELLRIDPPGLGPAPSYTHIIVADGPSKSIYISGQVPVDEDGRVIGVGDISAQARIVFEHLGAALRAGGARWEHLARVNTYLVNIDHLASVRAVREEFFDPDSPPTSTLIEVSRLFHPDFLIEVDAIAVVPS